MRIASRHMPKLARQPMGLRAWAFLALMAIGLVYAAISAPKTAAGVLAAAAVLWRFAEWELKRSGRALLALAEQRQGQSICEFAQDFDARAVDTWVIRAVFEQVQDELTYAHPAFPVRAGDRLKEDLLLDADDLDLGLAPDIARRSGRSLDDSDANPWIGKVRTVGDLVHFFQAQAKA